MHMHHAIATPCMHSSSCTLHHLVSAMYNLWHHIETSRNLSSPCKHTMHHTTRPLFYSVQLCDTWSSPSFMYWLSYISWNEQLYKTYTNLEHAYKSYRHIYKPNRNHPYEHNKTSVRHIHAAYINHIVVVSVFMGLFMQEVSIKSLCHARHHAPEANEHPPPSEPYEAFLARKAKEAKAAAEAANYLTHDILFIMCSLI